MISLDRKEGQGKKKTEERGREAAQGEEEGTDHVRLIAVAQFMQFEADQAEEENRRVEAARVAEESLFCMERAETEQLHRRSGIVDLLHDCRRQM